MKCFGDNVKEIYPSQTKTSGMTPLEYQRYWESQGFKVHFRLKYDKRNK